MCTSSLQRALLVALERTIFRERGFLLEGVSGLNNRWLHLAFDGNTEASVMLFGVARETQGLGLRACICCKKSIRKSSS